MVIDHDGTQDLVVPVDALRIGQDPVGIVLFVDQGSKILGIGHFQLIGDPLGAHKAIVIDPGLAGLSPFGSDEHHPVVSGRGN